MVNIWLPFPQILLLVFFVVLFAATLFSGFLIYHWRAYGESNAVVNPTIIVYLAGAFCAFAGMGMALTRAF